MEPPKFPRMVCCEQRGFAVVPVEVSISRVMPRAESRESLSTGHVYEGANRGEE